MTHADRETKGSKSLKLLWPVGAVKQSISVEFQSWQVLFNSSREGSLRAEGKARPLHAPETFFLSPCPYQRNPSVRRIKRNTDMSK